MEHFRFSGMSALCLLLMSLVYNTVHAVAVSGQGSWETTLLARDFDGNTATIEGWYDIVLGITWLADANYAQTSGYDANGTMNWTVAKAWAAGLDINGIVNWRLPNTNPVNGVAYNNNYYYNGTADTGTNISAPGTAYAGSTASEMAYMFYNTLGNLTHCDPATSTITTCSPQGGAGLTNTGPFSNIQNYAYWSGTDPLDPNAWLFNFGTGIQGYTGKTTAFYAWAVHSGDVGTAIVPIPTAVWMFLSGMLGMFGIAIRKK